MRDKIRELNEKEEIKNRDDIVTPIELVDYMISLIEEDFWKEDKKILDLCSGYGNFTSSLIEKTKRDNITLIDINEERIKKAKELFGEENIFLGDFFKNSLKDFDLIVSNPPYSGGGNKNKSISNLFIEESIERLNDKGLLLFVVPNNWMTCNNNNTTLKKLLKEGTFLFIDLDIKKFFKNIGSSFSVFLWKKESLNLKTKVKNSFLIKDFQEVFLRNNLEFLPLYLSEESLSLIDKFYRPKRENLFKYRCDLHNFTKKDLLSDKEDDIFKYKTIHTAKQERFSKVKQDIFDKYIIIIPLSTYYRPFIVHNRNVTQSVGYIETETKEEAEELLKLITKDIFRVLIYITRFGNFNNLKFLKSLDFNSKIEITKKEESLLNRLSPLIR